MNICCIGRNSETFTERSANGEIKSRWSGGVADDGRFLRHGKETWHYPNGELHYEANSELGRKVGSEAFHRSDGTIAWRWQHNRDGTSVWTQFWENGRKKSESTWRGSVANGKARTWDRSGRVLSDVNFMTGSL